MNIKDINTKKKPIVLIDKSLDFFNDKVLFPQKLEKANEMLKKIGLPKIQKVQLPVDQYSPYKRTFGKQLCHIA